MGPIFAPDGTRAAQPDWSGLDDVMALSRRYNLPVLGVLLDVPRYLSSCPGGPAPGHCPPTDPAQFAALAGQIAAHARGTIDHWEILNEPDGYWAFTGSAEDYARMLSASHDAIKAAAPGATVVLGGIMRPQDPAWIQRVFATPGTDAAHKFDVGNVHLRGGVSAAARRVGDWRSLLAGYGFTGPLWVTEMGYPSDPAFQDEPGYTGGEQGQAAFLTDSIVALAEAGASQVFVPLRDSNLIWRFASEGVSQITDAPGYPVRRKPAFEAVRRVSADWDRIVVWRASQRWHEREQARHEQAAAAWRQAARVARKRLQNARAAARVLAAGALDPARGRLARRGARAARARPARAGGAERASAGACAQALLSGRRRPSNASRQDARAACELRIEAETYRREWGWYAAMTNLERRIAQDHSQAAQNYAKLVSGR
jgi:hypothetical protein